MQLSTRMEISQIQIITMAQRIILSNHLAMFECVLIKMNDNREMDGIECKSGQRSFG